MRESEKLSYPKITNFLGANTATDDTLLDPREAAYILNMDINKKVLSTRGGSTFYSSNKFLDSTDSTEKNITSLYSDVLNETTYYVGTGGDAFKQYTGGAWVDKTGAVTITDDADIRWHFKKFFNTGGDEIFVGFNGVDDPIKWTGAGDAANLGGSPPTIGSFTGNYPVVYNNRLWIAVYDKVYFSGINDGESWDSVNDFIDDGIDLNQIYSQVFFNGSIVVFQKNGIYIFSGFDNNDIYVRKLIENDGCINHDSVQEINSYRYGRILVFLSSRDNTLKGFNGTKDLIELSYPISNIFSGLNLNRIQYSVSVNYEKEKKYWLCCPSQDSDINDFVIVYDYQQDIFSGEDGRPLSPFVFYSGSGMEINAIAYWNVSSQEYIITGNYDADTVRQDDGALDLEAETIDSYWRSSKLSFGGFEFVKELDDLAILTLQRSVLHLGATVNFFNGRQSYTYSSDVVINPDGPLWSQVLWSQFNWASNVSTTQYTQLPMTPTIDGQEGAIFGRYFQFKLSHSTPNERARIQQIIIGIINRGAEKQQVHT